MKGKKLSAIIAVAMLTVMVSPAFADTAAIPTVQAVTTAPTVGNILLANNVSIPDTVTVKGLKAKDVVKIYSDDEKTVITKAKVAKDGDAVVIVPKGFADEKIKISVTNDKASESNKVEVTVPDETQTTAPTLDNVVIANNITKAVTVTVKGLKAKDVVKVYSIDRVKLIGTAKLVKDGNATVSLPKSFSGDKVILSVTNYNCLESDKISFGIPEPAKSTTPTIDNIVVVNNVTKPSSLTIRGLKAKDVVKVYSYDEKKVLGTATAAKDGDVTVSLAKNIVDSKIKVSVTSDNILESDKVEISVPIQKKSTSVTSDNVVVANNGTKNSTVKVKGLKAKDIVKVYSGDEKAIIDTLQIAKDGDATLVIPKVKLVSQQKIKVSIISDNSLESDKTEITLS